MSVAILFTCLLTSHAHAAGVLDGTTQWVTMPPLGTTSITASWGQVTFAGWVKLGAPVGTSQRHTVLYYSTGTNAAIERVQLFVQADGSIGATARARDTDASANGGFTAAGVVLPGVWTHVAAAFSLGSRGTVTIYVNGAVAAQFISVPFSASAFPVTYPLRARIGATGDDFGSAALHGSVEDVRIYIRALSASEVAGIYADPNFFTPGAAAIYPINDRASYSWPAGPVSCIGGPLGRPSALIMNEPGPVSPPSP